ncbi:MAG: FAD-dependent oxidoreductase [Candidatus Hatepunaea meridiana]|nr:FAD-dependent oxidoreductase [Candidatus Hatepunaea meridiana]
MIKDKSKALAPCIATCPQGTDIRAVLTAISQADHKERPKEEAFEEAWRILTRTNPLPAVCGRVCPHPCETACNRCEKDCSVGINDIERFLGDWAIEHNLAYTKITEQERDEKIAVIGSGPAGLGCAYHLVQHGYKVTIFEALSETGGMLRYGIPAYRLPRKVIDAEVQKILDLGVELHTNIMVGKDIAFEDLYIRYDEVFVGVGAHQGAKLYCPGEDASNVYSGVEFLRRVVDGNLTRKFGDSIPILSDIPGKLQTSHKIGILSPDFTWENVIVIGGGDTAIDAARVAYRLGSKVTILYRRTRKEMPAINEEIEEAIAEGIDIQYLVAPKEIITENSNAVAMIVQRMELGVPDDSGRRRPVPIDGQEFTIETDSIIVAISQIPDWVGPDELVDQRGWIKTDENGSTNREKVFAGGDVTTLGLVTDAIAQGTRAAEAIHARLSGSELPVKAEQPIVTADNIDFNHIAALPRHEGHKLSVKERQKALWEEIKSTLPDEEVIAEANRCISCGSSFVKKKATPLLWLRRFTQLGIGTILFNSYFAVASTARIYDGPLRNICVPGLNCHACPTALMGCPIGMMQHFAATHRFPWFLIGFLGIIGLLSGRFTCGWLCPFGLVQDATNAFKRIPVNIPKLFNYFKYVVLVGLVIIIPYFTYEHWFSKLCPCGALIGAIPWGIWNPIDPDFGSPYIAPLDIGTMYWIKIWILAVCLLLFLFIKRPFCRTICPLGATYAMFNRVSLVSLKVKDSCVDCGRCKELCPMDLDFRKEINSENCIKCMDCTQCEHVEFEWNLPWKSGK